VLVEHRIDDVNEGLIAVEQPVSSGEQIALQPTLALVLTEHGVEDAPVGREEFIIPIGSGIPLAIGCFKDRAQKIRERLIGTEDPEVALIFIQLGHIPQELAQHDRVLAVDSAGGGHVQPVDAEVGHLQVAE
jgi:hypothetical protein